jgi:hypothetical protein
VEFREAVRRVLLEEAPEPLHWTRVQDLALRRGYLDPFTQRDLRGGVLRALAALAREGEIVRSAKGVYRAAAEA